jgi:hypothetical protein
VNTQHVPTNEVCDNGAPRYSPTSPAHRHEDEEKEVKEENGVPYSPSSPAYDEETNIEETHINVKSEKYLTQPQGGRYTPPHAQGE